MAIDRSLGWEPDSNTNGMFFPFFQLKLILLNYLKH